MRPVRKVGGADELGPERRLQLVQFVAGQFLDRVAVAAGQVARECVAGEPRLGLVDRQAARLLQQARRAGVLRQRQIGFAHGAVQVGQRLALRLIAFGGSHEFHQPGRRLRRIAEAHRQRPQGIEQPAGHLLPDTGQRHRHDAMRPDRAGIAEAGHGPRLLRIDKGDAIPFALQVGRRANTDNAGADNADMALGLIRHGRDFPWVNRCTAPHGARNSDSLNLNALGSEEKPWLAV